MSLKAKDIDRIFRKLDMQIRNSKDRIAFFYYCGKPVLKTRRSHGSGKINQYIIHLIRNQLRISETQLMGLLKCPLTKDDYIKILRGKNIIES